jgi:hypothetical protein
MLPDPFFLLPIVYNQPDVATVLGSLSEERFRICAILRESGRR